MKLPYTILVEFPGGKPTKVRADRFPNDGERLYVVINRRQVQVVCESMYRSVLFDAKVFKVKPISTGA